MILLPAIDIRGGHAVRLEQGAFDSEKIYDADPLDAARRWVAEGARALHVVDLDGARTGEPANVEHVRRICSEVTIPVQVGGGLRNIEAVRRTIEAGATRVVLGTAAYIDVDLLDTALSEYGDRVVVSVDVRNGKLAASGWTEQTELPVEPVIERLGARGVHRFVYSSIERDGMLEGPDLEGVGSVAAAVRGTFVYSGGVASLDDLRALVELRQVNLGGVIVGKALYEQRFTVADGQAVLGARKGDE
ncbi:MAG TPA: 1-(5-phosphoribosyl)-5-[(5-phosphoribosylamino)methylideneamino]imidazole-4-carboxamide isomerase [Solirubrobacteraceae bacterium]|nr:1-(5-phosphoribosyl)-5-[(5-phosphoribosylamino)methylideneamino]imidazole-4-carboxamide isomerase [Solirubrobacteraceae bacterium]